MANNVSMPRPIRIPDYMHRYFLLHGACFHCSHKLRHEIHAFNHWLRYHSNNGQPIYKYYIWSAMLQRWVGVDFAQYRNAVSNKVPTCVVKGA